VLKGIGRDCAVVAARWLVEHLARRNDVDARPRAEIHADILRRIEVTAHGTVDIERTHLNYACAREELRQVALDDLDELGLLVGRHGRALCQNTKRSVHHIISAGYRLTRCFAAQTS